MHEHGSHGLPSFTAGRDLIGYVPPGETMRFLVRAPAYADPDAPYMFHCHVLQHEDRGMMGQFVVVRREEETGAPAHP